MLQEMIKLKEALFKSGKKGIALDIDDTLSFSIYTFMDQLLMQFGNPENLTIEEMIKKYKFTYTVPYWQSPEVIAWFSKRLAENDLYEDVPLIKGADEAIREISKHVEIVAYISTRPISVLESTKAWLKKHKLPEAPLILRPMYVDPNRGSEWKADVLSYLSPEIQGIIDDNPSLVKYLPSDYKGKIFVYDNTTDRKDLDITICENWETVAKCVAEQFSK